MFTNYHTHTWRCKHCHTLSDEEFVVSAIHNKFRVLGFSDHTPWPYHEGALHPQMRMEIGQLPDYMASVRTLQAKYKDQINIYLGLECEYYPKYLPWLRAQREKVDYLILGNHWAGGDEHGEIYLSRATLPEQIEAYTTYTLEGMQTGLYAYLAHPDHVFSNYPVFDDVCRNTSVAICEKAKSLDMPLEYNLVGLEKMASGKQEGVGFPNLDFWAIAARVGCKAIIGFDAHRPDHLCQTWSAVQAKMFLRGIGINVLECIPGLE